MVQTPAGRGPQPTVQHRRFFGWLWAVKDLPDPSQDVLAAGDVVVLDRNGHLIEDWSPAGHYHVSLHLNEMGPYAPAASSQPSPSPSPSPVPTPLPSPTPPPATPSAKPSPT